MLSILFESISLSDILLSLLNLLHPRPPKRAHEKPYAMYFFKMNKLTHFKETLNCLYHFRLGPEDLKGCLTEDYSWPLWYNLKSSRHNIY